MFIKKSSHGLRAFILMLLSFVLFFCDHNYQCFDKARTKIYLAASPIQRAVSWPVRVLQSLSLNIARKQAIIEENERLINELLLISTKLQRLAFLEQENSELRSLLNASKQIKGKVLFAELIGSRVGALGQAATINRGELDGVYLGQPVLDATGVLGRVILVQDRSSKILFITSNKSAVPVMVVRNGLQAVVVGKNDNSYLGLVNITKTADLKVGDSLVTSGLGQIFPSGYMVGVVKSIDTIVGERFVKVLVTPKAKIHQGSHVVLIWPDSTKKVIRKGKK